MKIEEASQKLNEVSEKVEGVMVGNQEVIETFLIAFFSEGHVLLEGVPGIGKTTLAKSFAQATGGEFSRIQMTPDLLPADIVGTEIYTEGKSEFEIRKGPIFANFVLADEFNRGTPKVQSAFLEAMQERQVTIGGETRRLNRPFLVVATQIPFEQGTYPLTRVQLDRFAYRIPLGYPDEGEESEIMDAADKIEELDVPPALTAGESLEVMEKARSVEVDGKVRDYIASLVSRIRGMKEVQTGPSPRASIWLYRGSRVRAILEGRDYVIPDDVKYLSQFAVPHRVHPTTEAETREVSPDDLLAEALENTPVPKGLEG